ncbi:MAG: choice-of-anchor D domain-containing protein [Chthoniobacterales bacterium]
MKTRHILTCAVLLSTWAAPLSIYAAGLVASDGAPNDLFGYAVSESGSGGLVGVYNPSPGSAYVFNNLDGATGTVTQSATLTASDGEALDIFGYSVSRSGSIGLIAARGDESSRGSAYVFRNLGTATGNIHQNVKLTASDGVAGDGFGYAASLWGSIGLIGAVADDIGTNTDQGSAYVFRNLDTASDNVYQNVKLTALDGGADDLFGFSVSLSGNIGLVGAGGNNDNHGAAYVFRNLDTAVNAVYQNVKLIASDGLTSDGLGYNVSLSGSIGLVGATGKNNSQGAAYVFRNLDTAINTIYESVKLTASDGTTGNFFGISGSVSGSIGLVGANNAQVGSNIGQGAAYLFLNLDSAVVNVTENLKLTASDGAFTDQFGTAASLDGDHFLIGASNKNSSQGKAYSGTVSSMTTLDVGNANRRIDGLNFISKDDWIIGETTTRNVVNLASGSANVTADGKSIYVGRYDGADANILYVFGNVTATTVQVGSPQGTTRNSLVFDSGATFSFSNLRLAPNNFLTILGTYATANDLINLLGAGTLQTWNGFGWEAVTAAIAPTMITIETDGDYTYVTSTGSVLSLSGDLNFGSVLVGSSKSATLTIANTGNLDLSVYSIQYPSGFSGNFNGTIAAGASQDVTVTFTPTVGIAYAGSVSVSTDAISGGATMLISGNGLFAISLRAAPSYKGTISGAGSYAAGRRLTVVARPRAHKKFVAWKEGSRIVSRRARYTFTVTRNRSLVATFR